MMSTKWRVQIVTIVEVEADYSDTGLEEIINLAHGPAAKREEQTADVIAVWIDGRWFEAPPF